MRMVVEGGRELTQDWPPRVVEGRRNVIYPIRWDRALLNGPISVDREYVRFYSSYEGQSLLCSSRAMDEAAAAKLATVLEENQGKTVQSLDNFGVPEE